MTSEEKENTFERKTRKNFCFHFDKIYVVIVPIPPHISLNFAILFLNSTPCYLELPFQSKINFCVCLLCVCVGGGGGGGADFLLVLFFFSFFSLQQVIQEMEELQ